jgi:hypothetical protein
VVGVGESGDACSEQRHNVVCELLAGSGV